ncbi:uncharacterized protein LOC144819485 [Lissotriton helveticus]
MSKKRRKHCRRRNSSEIPEWKLSKHLQVGCKYNHKCIKIIDQKDEMDIDKKKQCATSQSLNLEMSDENSNIFHSADRNGNRSTTEVDSAKWNVPDDRSKDSLGGVRDPNCHPTASNDKHEEVIAVVTLKESKASAGGRIILQHSPSPVDSFPSSTWPITTEFKCDCLNVNVELKKGFLSNSRTRLLIEKGKCPKKSRSYHGRQHQKSQCFSYHCHENLTDAHGKHRPNPKNTAHVANKDSAILKVSISEKDIEVNYNKELQSVVVHIEPTEYSTQCDNKTKKGHKSYHSKDTDYPVTDGSCSTSPLPDDQHKLRDDSYFNCIRPEWYSDIPPPKEFADCKDPHSHTIREDGCPLLNKSSNKHCNISELPSWLTDECDVLELLSDGTADYGGDRDDSHIVESRSSQFNHNVDNQQKPSTSSVACLSYQAKVKSWNDAQLKNIHFVPCLPGNKKSYFGPKAVRRKTFPEALNETFLLYQLRKDSFLTHWSSPICRILPEEEEGAAITTTDSLAQEPGVELNKSLSCTSSLSSLLESKPSQTHDSTPSDHEMPLSLSEPEENADYIFMNDGDCATKDGKDNIGIPSFPSWTNVNSNSKKEDKDFEPLGSLSEEQPELTESGFDEEPVDSDHHNDAQDPTDIPSIPLSSKAASFFQCPVTPGNNSAKGAYSEWYSAQPLEIQSQFYKVSHALEKELKGKRRKSSVVTVVTGEQEQRVIIQGESQAPASILGSVENVGCNKDAKQPDTAHRYPVPMLEQEKEASLEKEFHSCFDIQSMFQKSLVLEEEHLQGNVLQKIENSDSFGSPEDKDFAIGEILKAPSENQSSQQVEENRELGECIVLENTPGASRDSETSLSLSETGDCLALRLVKSDSESYDQKKAEKIQAYSRKAEVTRKQFGKKDLRAGLVSKHLKLPKTDLGLKDTTNNDSACEAASDRWAKRRKQFKESKNCSSTVGSSATSNFTQDSVNSEDTRSMDLGVRPDHEEKGFYSENFHSASWIFRGDDGSPDNSPRCLSKRPRPVAIRERTVRITKGIGDYPWGFRIQFSKPILVTEVDTNGAAEEAGLQVGDIVMAVNGTDVTSIAHSEAAALARQGPDLLVLVVGSDISRCPNTPKPTCRGYLHKRTHSGILKGWRKRWFVLKHDGCLYYYKQKKDEGKCRPLEVMKLEGSEIGIDTTLGKPFVFRCVPQSGSRMFYFYATSNQEMKRWLEAMDKAVHPVNQNHVWVDVTLHNNSLPPLAIKNPECLGLLHQLDRNKDSWVPHYCILKDGCLYFYASMRATRGQGGLYLQGYTVSEQCIGSKGRCVIEVKPPSEEFKTFYLSAENVTENKRWITALKISISKWLPLHQAIQDFMNRPLEETRM